MGLLSFINNKRQERKDRQEAEKAEYERLRELCNQGEHQYVTIKNERQGDGDPNVEGYIWVTVEQCSVCGHTLSGISHEDDFDV